MLFLILLSLFSPIQPLETCTISWYAEQTSYDLTACGEIYDEHALTCASHFPIGTIFRLYYDSNTVTVISNDKGPWKTDFKGYAVQPLVPHPIRLMDLSKGAFKTVIGDLSIGLAEVEYEIIGRKIRSTMKYNLD